MSTSEKFNQFKRWKGQHLSDYNCAQIVILKEVKASMIFKNVADYNKFVMDVFCYVYEIRFFIDVFLMKGKLSLVDLWKDIKNYI